MREAVEADRHRADVTHTLRPRWEPPSLGPASTALISVGQHVEVEATWGMYQRMIAAYRQPGRALGTQLEIADEGAHRQLPRGDSRRHRQTLTAVAPMAGAGAHGLGIY